MKFIDLLKSIPVPERDAFATRCGTSWGYLKQIAYGNKQCGESLAINIERESGRRVTCESLCPTGVDWSYIRSTGQPSGPDAFWSSQQALDATS